jgi:hypothetical protein
VTILNIIFRLLICCATKRRPAAFTLIENPVTPSEVILANYKRAGKVKPGTVGA